MTAALTPPLSLTPPLPPTLARTDEATPVRGNPEQRKIAAYPLFDWLRFALASIVVLKHAKVPLPEPLDGNLAVCVFLALSGWLIGGILLETRWAELPRFFYNRTTRIWCPYGAALVLLYGLAAAVEGVDGNWFKYLFYDATFTHFTWTMFPRALTEQPLDGTANHFWSISVEEQFYLFAPMAMLLVRWGKQLWVWAIIAGLLLWQGSQFAAIALGVGAAVANRDYGTNARGIAWNTSYRGPALAAVVAVGLFVATCYAGTPQNRALFALAVVLAVALPGSRGVIGMFLGAISYPLYLNHWVGIFIAHVVAKRVDLGFPIVQQLLSYLAAIAVAIAAWFVIDRQVMARRNDWYTPARGQVLGVVAYALLGIGLIGGFVILRSGG